MSSETVQTTYSARFAGFIALFGLIVAVGLVTFEPAVIAAGGVLLVFLLAGLTQTPTPPASHLTATYDVQPKHPRPADTVTVTVTIENRSEHTFTDLRVVDTVPDELQLVDGTARAGGPLRPNESLTMEYDVLARRGSYTFGPVIARTRTTVGSMWADQILSLEGKNEMRCAVRADDIPLEEQATHFIGSLLSDTGGEGVEFFATREYHRGDPPSKIHWRELAIRGELSTVTYRERQAAEVTIVTDVRPSTAVSPNPGEPTAAQLAGYATYQVLASLVDYGHFVGVTLPGIEPDEETATGGFPYWRIDHKRSKDQKRLALDMLDAIESNVVQAGARSVGSTATQTDSEPTFHTGRDETKRFDPTTLITIGDFVRDVTAWSTPNSQFVCVTPLLDDAIHGFCERLYSQGVPVVIISPDSTIPLAERDNSSSGDGHTSTPAAGPGVPDRIVRLQRATRVESLRQQGMTVIDWHPSQPLSVACKNQTLPGV